MAQKHILYTRCIYVFVVYSSCTQTAGACTYLSNLWTDMCITVSRCGTCFWASYPCATKVWAKKLKNRERWQSIH